jgi:hypothetical protein
MSERGERIDGYSCPARGAAERSEVGSMSERSERIDGYSCPARGAAERSEVGT